jgi:hypothetical protein
MRVGAQSALIVLTCFSACIVMFAVMAGFVAGCRGGATRRAVLC